MIDLSPLAIPASMRLLSPRLPSPPATVLEVGCGRGALAAELQRRGYAVTGVDPAPDSVAAARARGVTVVAERFEEYGGGTFDVVLFTRSLHHVEDLAVTLDAALRHLAPGGAVVLEEFATDGITGPAAAFVYDTLEILAAAGVAAGREREHSDPFDQWRSDRAHLLTRAEMLAGLEKRLTLGPVTPAPTLWRMIASQLTGPDPAAAAAIARSLQDIETRRIAAGELPALGFAVAGRIA
ncbi:MAG TPA: class I SAM-dependent methyltransferase [Mycobacteriales bacterium]|nr:class I SAM-dependent methyltransferase [Mycobacteriales bacterium]